MPKDIQLFLEKLVQFYLAGSRNEKFADSAAMQAMLLLECYDLL